MTKIDIDALEHEIDRHGLTGVLQALADVCHEKAAHVQSTWQDKHAARAWWRAAKAIERLTTTDAVVQAPL